MCLLIDAEILHIQTLQGFKTTIFSNIFYYFQTLKISLTLTIVFHSSLYEITLRYACLFYSRWKVRTFTCIHRLLQPDVSIYVQTIEFSAFFSHWDTRNTIDIILSTDRKFSLSGQYVNPCSEWLIWGKYF